MKRFILLFSLLGLVFLQTHGQENYVKNDAELGDRSHYFSLCWGMGAVTVSDNNATLLNGDFSMRTNQLTNKSNKATWIKSPWMVMEAGEISFVTRLDGKAGGNRDILIQYIPFDADMDYGEGEEVEFDSFSFPHPVNKQTTVHKVTANIPEAIVGKTVKIFISFTGTGGSARAGLDDLVIPGKYAADPSYNCLPKVEKQDKDGDGVVDAEDDYPEDKYKAFDNYLTSKSAATLMFEDLWPAKGDYDFNDLVLDYMINRITDASGEIVEVVIDLLPRAAGAGYSNGFGIEFTGIAPDQVYKVVGSKIKSNSIHKFLDNGLEAGNKYATIIAFDDVDNVLTHPGGGAVGINTDPKFPMQSVEKIQITMYIKDGDNAKGHIKLDELKMDNFNPFLIVNQERGVEIHLTGKTPTAHVDKSLFGTKEDNSNGDEAAYYRGKDNGLPWALNVAESIPYMMNKESITTGYKMFYKWAATGGEAYPDWYKDKDGYRLDKVLLNAK